MRSTYGLALVLLTVLFAVPATATFPGTAAGGHAPAATGQPGAPAPSGPQVSEQNTYLGITVFTCTDFTAAGTGSDILDRDNTGTGQETDNIHVTDGAGTVLYDLTFTNALGTYTGGLINTTLYVTPPRVNPITMTVTSLAGNGLPEEVDYVASGVCSGLPVWPAIPTLSSGGMAALALLLGAFAFVALRRARRPA
ncbi:MAG: IPTL-CTERM sorting domain-containing protein [Thermoanaerobaculia bacterium]